MGKHPVIKVNRTLEKDVFAAVGKQLIEDFLPFLCFIFKGVVVKLAKTMSGCSEGSQFLITGVVDSA